jgi:anti-sigma factor RsiW
MHAVVLGRLEEYMSGALEPAAQRDFEAHLNSCERCREEILGMQEISQVFSSLRTEEMLDPSPGFYSKVIGQVGERKAVPSFARLFALDLAFGRRLVFASLLTLAVLGGYLVSRETGYRVGPSPETVMAQENSAAFDSAPAEDNMLVTLTAYEY